MTIAISLKVNDGLVLAADSAATLSGVDPGGGMSGVSNVYNNANKIYNLKKGLPIGGMAWGLGGIGGASISTLAKDLRKRFAGRDHDYPKWKLDEDAYTMEEVANRAREFLYEECYVPLAQESAVDPSATMSFAVAGYSSRASAPEVYHIEIVNGTCGPPELMVGVDDPAQIVWEGQPQAISRLLLGYDPRLGAVLQQNLGVPPDQVEPALGVIEQALSAPLIHPAMPIQDAIDLAEFLVDLTIGYLRFNPGAPTVGGPVEVAAITKHEGFKWIKRKHYFGRKLNPEELGGELNTEED